MPRGTNVGFSASFGEPTGAVWSRYRSIIRTASPSLFLRPKYVGHWLSTSTTAKPSCWSAFLKIEIISRMW